VLLGVLYSTIAMMYSIWKCIKGKNTALKYTRVSTWIKTWVIVVVIWPIIFMIDMSIVLSELTRKK